MSAHKHEVLTHHLPYLLPHKSNAGHVQVSNLYEALKTEFPGVGSIIQFFDTNLAQALDELNNRILVQIETCLENGIKLGRHHVLNN